MNWIYWRKIEKNRWKKTQLARLVYVTSGKAVVEEGKDNKDYVGAGQHDQQHVEAVGQLLDGGAWYKKNDFECFFSILKTWFKSGQG